MPDFEWYSPWFLLLFLLFIPLLIRDISKQKRKGVKVPTIKNMEGSSGILVILFILKTSKYIILSALIIAMARPRTFTVSQDKDDTKGIDIMLAVDVSLSMLAKDLAPDRLTALKNIAIKFVEKRPNDRLGLVTYSGEAFTKVPVTSDHEVVIDELKNLNPLELEPGTAIGEGLSVAVNHLRNSKAKSKIIILMTDGVNTIQNAMPAQVAAELAKNNGIKVYSIGIGTNGYALMPTQQDIFGDLVFTETEVRIDEELLREVAQTTNGRYFRATSNSSLEEVYDEINQLEKSDMKISKLYNYQEYFTIFLWVALGMLIIDALLRWVFYKFFKLMDWYLGDYWKVFLLLLLPLLAIFLFRFLKWKNKKRTIFADTKFHEDLFEKKSGFIHVFPILYFLGTLFLIFSIIDLLNGSEEVKSNQRTNNVIFMLDVSNSMNAEDIDPSRLNEAKNLMINTMQKMKSDKVGIVIFAGEAVSIMPLTTDYNSAETYINAIETNSMQIQGTDFLKGMQIAVDKFKNVSKGSRKIVLLSDGEDNEGNDNTAIKLANKEGVTVTSVGIGSDEGAPVPEYVFGQLMGYKTDKTGETVISKRQTEALKKMAESTGGSYIDGNNINEAPNRILDAISKKMSSSQTMVKSQNANHYYQYFLIISIFLFFLIYIFNPKRDLNI